MPASPERMVELVPVVPYTGLGRGSAQRRAHGAWKVPSGAIRDRCLDCGGEVKGSSASCAETTCDLWPFKKGRGFRGHGSPLKAIRRYCRWCCLKSNNEVRLCGAEGCPLWWYRFGVRPATLIRRAERKGQEGA